MRYHRSFVSICVFIVNVVVAASNSSTNNKGNATLIGKRFEEKDISEVFHAVNLVVKNDFNIHTSEESVRTWVHTMSQFELLKPALEQTYNLVQLFSDKNGDTSANITDVADRTNNRALIVSDRRDKIGFQKNLLSLSYRKLENLGMIFFQFIQFVRLQNFLA